ncbi:rRNA maturation RNase YbeY [Parahaliea sp. F7430]|uniref:Endoribonuclease YbeY n=1 Tax=Sediminihaliea albiluteola TaxID=2758564 RepID=A0A7W2TYM6_9GAMM|nr:rRNA maturation RNase YbeY [Sediminihaliea albiluteola]MBA6414346.1 rRNA maturation RNase YbeY [Sediminihaliea albiluteola]
MNLTVDVQCASAEPVPDEDDIRSWISAALSEHRRERDSEVSVRLVDSEEMAQLNLSYRGKSGPTNVLSFPADLPEGLDLPLLGDIVICAPVVAAEAAQQHKALHAHWAHMTVHGTLHLLGYDHINDHDAAIMEALETRILATMAIPCPYHSETGAENDVTTKEQSAP